MVCHGQHTYIYAQVMLQILSQEAKGGNNIRRLQQEITKYAINKLVFTTLPTFCFQILMIFFVMYQLLSVNF